MSIIKKVQDWRKAFGLTYGERKPNLPKHSEVALDSSLIVEETTETVQAMQNKDIVEVADGLADLIFVITQAANSYGIDLEKAVDCVHVSNMSKICQSKLDLELTINKYEELGVELSVHETGEDRWVVKRASDGKVMKSVNYKEPDFSWLVIEE